VSKSWQGKYREESDLQLIEEGQVAGRIPILLVMHLKLMKEHTSGILLRK